MTALPIMVIIFLLPVVMKYSNESTVTFEGDRWVAHANTQKSSASFLQYNPIFILPGAIFTNHLHGHSLSY
ncbi:hypothetical protein M758_1G187500 [Ceratodon purpureus]|nr:hypothetical protein M758_1G187500 [Ceratodon purpureus]